MNRLNKERSRQQMGNNKIDYYLKQKKKSKFLIKIGIWLMVLAPILFLTVFFAVGLVYCSITGQPLF